MPQFVPSTLRMQRVVHAPPCIDPLSVKNLDLATPFVDEICKSYGIDPTRPIVCQISRFDPWKDPVGVIEAFRIVREQVPDAQLVLAGSMATDDPEGFHYWELAEAAAAGDPHIHLLSNIQQVGSVQINAFQRAADVVVQKSLREGFGLTVSEASVEGPPGGRRPVRRHHAADRGRRRRFPRRLRSRTARSASSNCSPTRSRRRDGRGRPRARPPFVPVDPGTRRLASPVRITVNGAPDDRRLPPRPLPVHETADGTFHARRGAGGVVSALGPLLRGPRRTGRTGSPPRSATTTAPRSRPACAHAEGVASTSSTSIRRSTACTTTSCRTACCGSCTTACSTSSAVRASTCASARRGTRTSQVNRTFADAVAGDARRRGDMVLVQDYQLCLVPQFVTRVAPRPARSCTSRTSRSAARRRSASSPTTSPRRCAAR